METLINEVLTRYSQVYSNGYADKSGLDRNRFWGGPGNIAGMMARFRSLTSPESIIHSIQDSFMYSVNLAPDNNAAAIEYAVDWKLQQELHDGFNIFAHDVDIQESIYSNPKYIVERNGKRLTPDFLRVFNIASIIYDYFPKVNTIFEIGAGCGHLARSLRLLNKSLKTYYILDIPETLNASYLFTRLNFPDLKCLYVNDKSDLDNIEEYDCVFISPGFVDELSGLKVDLFVNTASMGEMTNPVIRRYMKLVQQDLAIKYVYTCNRYLNTMEDNTEWEWRKDENECSVLYDNKWNILQWQIEPTHTQCPYLDTIVARYVEIIARRGEAQTDGSMISDKLLDSVHHEDWYRNPTWPKRHSIRENTLVHNMTMTGTMFKLWESIRLHPNKRNVQTMLKYMDEIVQAPLVFEEYFYYERLLGMEGLAS